MDGRGQGALPARPQVKIVWRLLRGEDLEWLSREQSVEEDIDDPGFVLFTRHLTREELRKLYHDINYRIQVRPYDYRSGDNVYLEKAETFIKRK